MQVDVDQACLELNDRSRHPINHFMSCMSCPLDDIQRSRLEVASKIGLCSPRLLGLPPQSAPICRKGRSC